MSLIPIAKAIIKLALCLGPIFLGIRCLWVFEPKTDSFVYDVRSFLNVKGMSRRKWWVRNGIMLIILGIILTLMFFGMPIFEQVAGKSA